MLTSHLQIIRVAIVPTLYVPQCQTHTCVVRADEVDECLSAVLGGRVHGEDPVGEDEQEESVHVCLSVCS